jgi:hypothetical protein
VAPRAHASTVGGCRPAAAATWADHAVGHRRPPPGRPVARPPDHQVSGPARASSDLPSLFSPLIGRAGCRRTAMVRRFFGPQSQWHGRCDWGWPVRSSFGSSFDSDGAAAVNFDARGEEFVNSSVIEAGNFFPFVFVESWRQIVEAT